MKQLHAAKRNVLIKKNSKTEKWIYLFLGGGRSTSERNDLYKFGML
jgi:hypothetical protein